METLTERATRLGIGTATVGEMLDEIERLREKVDYLADGMRDVFPAAHRLALELECLLLDTKDTVAVSKWWGSGNEALEQWREFCREDEKVGAGETATLEAEIEAAGLAEAERQMARDSDAQRRAKGPAACGRSRLSAGLAVFEYKRRTK